MVHLYSAFSMKHAQRRFTMISLPPGGPKAYIGASGSRFKAIHVCWYSFYRPQKDGKLSEL